MDEDPALRRRATLLGGLTGATLGGLTGALSRSGQEADEFISHAHTQGLESGMRTGVEAGTAGMQDLLRTRPEVLKQFLQESTPEQRSAVMADVIESVIRSR
jgi:hypothetical protein